MKKSRWISGALCLFLSLSAFGCGGGGQSENGAGAGTGVNSGESVSAGESAGESVSSPSNEYMSVLTDKKFRRGFDVRGLGLPIYPDHASEETYGNPYDTGYRFQYGKEDLDEPVWQVCQWSTRYAFHDPSVTSFTANGSEYTYENPSKLFRVNTQTGEFTLGLRADKCYVYGTRGPGQEWPHLLISRDIRKSAFTKISDKKEIRVTLDATLDLYEDKMDIVPEANLHAAQCLFYLYISNYDEATANFTDMLWLGLSLFDNRAEFTDLYARADVGTKESETGKFVYNIPSEEYLSKTNNFYYKGEIKQGNSVSVDFNVLPHIEKALKTAQENECMEGVKYENLYINGMYVGFELPGTYNLQMSFGNMDIKVK